MSDRDRGTEQTRLESAGSTDRNEGKLWASCPTVKQDGGQQGTLSQREPSRREKTE